MKYPASELVLNAKGEVYHLALKPEQLADIVILVGDQDRVALVSNFFDSIEHQSQHREFVCHTGTFKGKRISAISSGIGTDNIDITINEIDALANIDLITRNNKPTHRKLDLIRIGTCGILQSDIPVHSYILSSHAVGLDNVAHFYPITFSEKEQELAQFFHAFSELPNTIIPYAVEASSRLYTKLYSEKTNSGITVTSSGFYAPQGRALRLGLVNPEINERLAEFRFDENRILNFEMESSALFSLGKALGHEVATICLGVANRPNMEFSKGYTSEMNALIEYVLERV